MFSHIENEWNGPFRIAINAVNIINRNVVLTDCCAWSCICGIKSRRFSSQIWLWSICLRKSIVVVVVVNICEWLFILRTIAYVFLIFYLPDDLRDISEIVLLSVSRQRPTALWLFGVRQQISRLSSDISQIWQAILNLRCCSICIRIECNVCYLFIYLSLF